VLGGSGRDSLIGGLGKNKLFDQGGDDYLSSGGGGNTDIGADLLNGGKGNDIYDISGYASVYDNGGRTTFTMWTKIPSRICISANSPPVSFT
jgi:hypothetical protein